MKVALAQVSPKLNRSNIDMHMQEIASCDADVIVFPELSLNGYLLQDKVYEDAFTLDELDCFVQASRNIDIVLGCALRQDHRIFNAGIYFQKVKSYMYTIRYTFQIMGCLKRRVIISRVRV